MREDDKIRLTSSYCCSISSGGRTIVGTCAGAGATVGAGDGAGTGVDVRLSVVAAVLSWVDVDCGRGVVPGFAGKDGCKGRGGDAAGARGGTGVATSAGRGIEGAGAGVDSLGGAAAFARACASLSAVFISCVLRIAIRASSCAIFFTKSLTSPGLMRKRNFQELSFQEKLRQ